MSQAFKKMILLHRIHCNVNPGINSKVTYKAKDVVSLKNRLKKIFMKNEAEVYYEDMQISTKSY